MGRVYFHTLSDGDAVLSGSERAYGACLAKDMVEAVWGLEKTHPGSRVTRLVEAILPKKDEDGDTPWYMNRNGGGGIDPRFAALHLSARGDAVINVGERSETLDGRISFKVISNRFLLKGGE